MPNKDNVELDDNGNEVAEAHDTKTAEKQSIGAHRKAAEVTKRASMRKGDKSNSEPMPKSKAGMISVAHDLMSEMTEDELSDVMLILQGDDEDDMIGESRRAPIKVDFTEDLDALVDSEATLSEDFKAKTAIIFEAAVNAKLTEELDRLEEAYSNELNEEVEAIKADLVEKVDNYLDYAVTSWMEENQIAIEAGIRTEIAENFMLKLKDLLAESYVDVPEDKVDLVDDLANANAQLEEQLNSAIAKNMELTTEANTYKRYAVLADASRDLADTQAAKLESLTATVDFFDVESFTAKVATIKESYFKPTKTATSVIIDEDTETGQTEEVNESMANILKQLRKINS